MNKILIVNTFGIGDVLHTTPLIASLKKALPNVSISMMVNRRCALFLKQHPDINHIHVYERDEFDAIGKKSPLAYWQAWLAFLKEIKREKYDVAFDLSMNRNLSFFVKLTGIKRRIGYNYKNRGRFLTDPIDFKGFDDQHVADYFLALLEKVGITDCVRQLSLPVIEEDQAWARAWLRDQGIKPDQHPIALLPGGGTSWGKNARFRRWPSERFAQLADKVIEKSGAPLILMGDPTERELCQEIIGLMKRPAFMATGETSITQLSALLRQCTLSISNDGGPLHIAVASGVKTVSIFGPVDEQIYGPYPVEQHRVIKKNLPCQPCYRRFRMPACAHMSCLRDLQVDEVFEQMKEMLSSRP